MSLFACELIEILQKLPPLTEIKVDDLVVGHYPYAEAVVNERIDNGKTIVVISDGALLFRRSQGIIE